MFVPGDALRHAGGGPAGLAEEHGVSTLHEEQQTDYLVLAGTVTLSRQGRFKGQKVSSLNAFGRTFIPLVTFLVGQKLI